MHSSEPPVPAPDRGPGTTATDDADRQRDEVPDRRETRAARTGGGSLRSRVGRVAAASAAALVFTELVTLVQTVVLARLLTPAQVGLFVAGGVLTSFVTTFVEGGLRSGLVHRERDLDDAAATVFWATLGTGLLMALLSLAAAPLVGRVFGDRSAGTVAAALSGGLLLYALTNVPEALLQREFSVRRRLVVGPAVSVTFAAVSVSTAALGLGVWSMVVGSYASSFVWVLTLWWICDWRPWRGRPSYRLWRDLARFGFPLVLGMLGDRAQKATQSVATGSVLGAGDLGLLRYGERMAQIPVRGLVEVSSVSLFPAFARLSGDRPRFRVAYLRALRLSTAAAAPVTALVGAVGVPLVVLVLGEEWRGAGYVLVAMAGLGLGKSLMTVSEEAIKGAGRTRLLNRYTLMETTLGVVLLLVLIGPLGLVGVGLAISLTAVVLGVALAAGATAVIGVSARETLGATVPAVVSALVGCAVVLPLEHLVLHSAGRGTWGLASIALDGVVLLLVYAVALRVLAPALVQDVTALAARVWRRPPAGPTSRH